MRISKEQKREFLKNNEYVVKEVFEFNSKAGKKFLIERARQALGYSKKTVDIDILISLRKVY